jgi:hypothetical protein
MSYTMAGTVVNTGSCITAGTCDIIKAGAAAAATDFECSECSTDSCNAKNGDTGGDGGEPEAATSKDYHMEYQTGGDGPKACLHMKTSEDCTLEKIHAVNDAFFLMQSGDCSASYKTECSISVKHGEDDTTTYPATAPKEESDQLGCGTVSIALMTEDCAGCTAQKDHLDEGEEVVSGPTCSSASALAFGLAALVASLFF